MIFACPTGIGDVVWALHKIQAINEKLGGGPIEVWLRGSYNEVDRRALDFVRRFKFIDKVSMEPFCIHKEGEPEIRPDGTYNYMNDGLYMVGDKKYCLLIPNEALERGCRLEDWLPHHKTNWNIFEDFEITAAERQVGADLLKRIGPYAVFYPGPLTGNTRDGHNRNGLWKPEDWVNLGQAIRKDFGLEIVLVGAPYDYAYYEQMLEPTLARFWHNMIGKTNLGELWGITQQANFVISYQAGVGIVSTYLGTPTGIFWRQQGDSISPKHYLSFDERMASAWVPKKYIENGNHLPLYYGRHGVPYVLAQIAARNWAVPIGSSPSPLFASP